MRTIKIQLLKPGKGQVIEFSGQLLRHEHGEIVIRAVWERPRLDLGYVVFETGDMFTEHYYTDRWYTIYVLRSSSGLLKGWYCNVARPAAFDGVTLTSEDVELDLFVTPDRAMLLPLDVDEFEARGFQHNDTATYRAALQAMAELERLARAGEPPFEQM